MDPERYALVVSTAAAVAEQRGLKVHVGESGEYWYEGGPRRATIVVRFSDATRSFSAILSQTLLGQARAEAARAWLETTLARSADELFSEV